MTQHFNEFSLTKKQMVFGKVLQPIITCVADSRKTSNQINKNFDAIK